MSEPRQGLNTGVVERFRIGMADANSGIDPATFSVKSDLSIEGRPPLAELADLFVEVQPGIHLLALSDPLPPSTDRHLLAEVADVQGNIIRHDVKFSIEDPSNVYHELTVTKTGPGNGTIVSNPGGINCGLDCEESFLDGTVVVLDPQPDEGSVFEGWSGDPDCLDGQVTLTGDLTCTADYSGQPVLTVSKTGAGAGTITSSPGGINCGSDCSEAYDLGTLVNLAATPDPGSTFIAWSGDPDCLNGSVTMNGNRTCSAQFELVQPLTVALEGTGSGNVTTNPAGINCPPDCQEDFIEGTVVTLIQTPSQGSAFTKFTGGTECASGVVTMDEAHNCIAWFTDLPDLYIQESIGSGSGTVTSNPGGINCGNDCEEPYPHGTVVSLTATPDPGSTFVTWKGFQNDCLDGVLTMNGDRTCWAEFDAGQHTVTVAKLGTGSGTITSVPSGINCGSNCTEDYSHGTVVTLNAQPSENSIFSHWQGHPDCADGSLTVTQSMNCQAVFDLVPANNYVLTYSLTGEGSGTVTSNPNGINCEPNCAEPFAQGTVVTMTAVPDPGSVFVAWQGSQGDCTDGVITMNGSRQCAARFDLAGHTVTITKIGSGIGTVQSQPSGLNCGTVCEHEYANGTTVTLIPRAAKGSVFDGWQGDPDCADGVLTVTGPRDCTAKFEIAAPNEYTLTTILKGSGTGSVTSSPAGINCPADCQEDYTQGTVVTLTPVADPGSAFAAWAGSADCVDGVVTMNKARTCKAFFNRVH